MGGFGIAGAGEHASALLSKLGWVRRAPGFYVKEPAGLQDALRVSQALVEAGAVSGCHLISYTERVDLGQALAGEGLSSVSATAPAPHPAQSLAGFGLGVPYDAPESASVPADPLAALMASGMLDEGDDVPSDAREGKAAGEEDAEGEQDKLTRAEQAAREEEEYALQMMQEMGLR